MSRGLRKAARRRRLRPVRVGAQWTSGIARLQGGGSGRPSAPRRRGRGRCALTHGEVVRRMPRRPAPSPHAREAFPCAPHRPAGLDDRQHAVPRRISRLGVLRRQYANSSSPNTYRALGRSSPTPSSSRVPPTWSTCRCQQKVVMSSAVRRCAPPAPSVALEHVQKVRAAVAFVPTQVSTRLVCAASLLRYACAEPHFPFAGEGAGRLPARRGSRPSVSLWRREVNSSGSNGAFPSRRAVDRRVADPKARLSLVFSFPRRRIILRCAARPCCAGLVSSAPASRGGYGRLRQQHAASAGNEGRRNLQNAGASFGSAVLVRSRARSQSPQAPLIPRVVLRLPAANPSSFRGSSWV